MSVKKIIGIMACDPNGVIGNEGILPWDYPEDAAYFRDITAQQLIVMGHKTFVSLPPELLSNRNSIVFMTHHHAQVKTYPYPVSFVRSIPEFLQSKQLTKCEQCYMIGGGEIAKLFLEHDLIDEFLLTQITKCYAGDAFFPLALIQHWPKKLIKQTAEFSINCYINPRSA